MGKLLPAVSSSIQDSKLETQNFLEARRPPAMRRILVRLLGVGTVLALIVGPVVYAFHEERQTRNFHIVREGVLYRSARMALPGLKRIAHDYGIRSVISLRDADAADRAEEDFCRKEEINFFRLPPK